MDPPVSEPRAAVARFAATAAAEPPLDPPGTRARSLGFRVATYAEFSVEEPMANKSQLVLPRMHAPADSSRGPPEPRKGAKNSPKSSTRKSCAHRGSGSHP